MVIFKNSNYPTFLSEITEKRIILFGSGGTFRDFLANNAEKLALLEAIDFILDNDASKVGQEIYLPIKTLKIQSVDNLLHNVTDLSNYVVLLLVADQYALDIVKQLDDLPQFDRVICYYGLTTLTWGREIYPPLPLNAQLPKPNGNYSIPKVIHYIWFGRQLMGDLIERCIMSWNRHCPDYELKLWNEDNYDLLQAPSYVWQAYEAKKFAFVSDYVRLDVVYKYGGFYLDTDVELLKSLDNFVSYKAIFGYLAYNQISTGLGFGSVPGNKVLADLRKKYEQLTFKYPNGKFNLIDCPRYETDYFRINGYKIENTLLQQNDMLFLPSSYLCSLDLVDGVNEYKLHLLYALTNNSCALHHCTSSWFESSISEIFKSGKIALKGINERLLTDWKRIHGEIE